MTYRTCLIVESDEPLIQSLVSTLAEEGIEALVAKGGREALDVFFSKTPSAVIIDVDSAGLDAGELIENLTTSSSDGMRSAAPLIIVLSEDKRGGKKLDDCTKGAVFSFIGKPVNVIKFKSVLRDAMNISLISKNGINKVPVFFLGDEHYDSSHILRDCSDLQMFFDTIPIGILYIGKDMTVLKVNGFIEKLTGKTKAELTAKRCYEVLGEKVDGQSKDKEPEVCSFCRKPHCLLTKSPSVVERLFGEKHLKVTIIPKLDADGEATHYLEVIEDITSLLETEQKIVLNSQMQSVVDLILQISLEPIALQEQLERILDFIFKIPKLALESKGCVFLADETSKKLRMKAQRGLSEPVLNLCNELPYNRCICGRVAQSREAIYAPDIDERHDITFESMQPHGHYCVPIISGQKLLGVLNLFIGHNHKRDTDEEEFLATVANTIANVIERKNAEEFLREQKEFLRSIVQSTQDAIITIDSNGVILFWNDGAEKTFGYKPGDVVGKTLDFVIPERFRHRHNDGIKRVITTGLSSVIGKTFELTAINIKGEEFPVELSLAMWKNYKETFFTGILRDISRRKSAQAELHKSVEKLRKVIGGIIQTIAMTVEVRDPYTAGHQRRVADLARAIATEMKLSEDTIDAIRMAGTIHDIGKIYVPAEILSRPGKLSDIEFDLIKMHPEVGFDILKTIEFPWPVARIVLEHHEKWDGSGYPLGIKGNEILLEARIICVADVIEAISFHRPYRPGLGIERAIAEIKKARGTLFDPDVVDAAVSLLTEGRFKFD